MKIKEWQKFRWERAQGEKAWRKDVNIALVSMFKCGVTATIRNVRKATCMWLDVSERRRKTETCIANVEIETEGNL